MKKIKKLSLSKVVNKLTRNEMRYVLAGSGVSGLFPCYCNGKLLAYVDSVDDCLWTCKANGF